MNQKNKKLISGIREKIYKASFWQMIPNIQGKETYELYKKRNKKRN